MRETWRKATKEQRLAMFFAMRDDVREAYYRIGHYRPEDDDGWYPLFCMSDNSGPPKPSATLARFDVAPSAANVVQLSTVRH